MEQNTPKFRLRLNLFDAIVLVLALAVGAFLLWSALKPAAPAVTGAPPAASAVRYTVRFSRLMEGTSALIKEGDELVDTIRNYNLGRVVSVETMPARTQILDQVGRTYVLAEVPGYEDAMVTVESTWTEGEDAMLLDGGFKLRVGAMAYVRGEGYMGSGPIVSIERGGQA